ncbi:retron system putative HNH endonuclease [uncultured Microscilla sp.]|uniref:retron system putative HNH endonuclease n=1 Tax=uncultured Microscilla sp. TaxID=432653 RepID=UPI002617C893|nr:retron system putative HNH endonuclease [uncultured Microscilla sp.]
MVRIYKTEPLQGLIDFNEKEKGRLKVEYPTEVKHPEYDDLDTDTASKLRKQLHEEQKGLCCYCMKKISASNSNIEHFLPQSLFPEDQTNYHNLYLACRYSVGKKKETQYCDIVKGDKLISKLMGYFNEKKNEECEDFFRYSEIGHILPNNSRYKTLKDVYKNYANLSSQEKEVMGTIEVLNLNTEELRKERAKFIEDIVDSTIKSIDDINKLEQIIKEYKEGKQRFKGIVLYFAKDALQKLKQKTKTN